MWIPYTIIALLIVALGIMVYDRCRSYRNFMKRLQDINAQLKEMEKAVERDTADRIADIEGLSEKLAKDNEERLT